MSRNVVRYRTEDSAVIAIKGPPGRIYTQLVWIDVPLRLSKVANGDVDSFSTILADVKVRKAAKDMLRIGKRLGITKGAKKFLRACM